MNLLKYFRHKTTLTPKLSGAWPLDLPLVRFSESPQDTWTLQDAFQGVLIMGENGSGKTSGSGKHFARKYLQNGFGGLILCFKTDEADLWRSYLRAAGREDDGRFFGVEESFHFNFMDYEAKASGVDFADNSSRCLSTSPASSAGPKRAEPKRISGSRKRRSSCVTPSLCCCYPKNPSSFARSIK